MKLTAHDVRELSEAIREIAAWNATARDKAHLGIDGPFGPPAAWNVGVYINTEIEYHGEGETLGDAVDAAMKAWKEGRG